MKQLVLIGTFLLCGFTMLGLQLPKGQAQSNVQPQGRIAFTSTRIENKKQIYVMDADGKNQTALTTKGENWKPAFSRDGKKVAFVSNRDGNEEIYVMDFDGSNQQNVTKNPAYDGDPCFSPNGQKIAFHSNRDANIFQIYVMEITGKNPKKISTINTDEYGAAWTLGDQSSGSTVKPKIAYHQASTSNLMVMDEDGGNRRRLENGANASWSFDGSSITFWAEKNGKMNIFAMNGGGTGLRQITDGTTIQRDPCWSLDNNRIVFVSNAGGSYDIYSIDSKAEITPLLNAAGKPSWNDEGTKDKLLRLTDDAGSDFHPSCGR